MSRSRRSLALAGVLATALPALAVDTVIRRGGEFVVNSRTYGAQRRVDVASSAAGEFVVVWQTYPQYVFDIHAQRFDASGTRAGGEIDVTADPFPQDHPSVGVAADGSFVVVWEDYEYSYGGSLYRIAGRRFGSGGSPVGSEFKINTTDGTYYNTAVASAPAGDFIVAWASYSDPDDGDDAAVRARRFDANGTPLANDFPVNTYTTGFQDSPQLTRAADGSFVVVWQDAARQAIAAQRYDNAGAPLGGEFLVNTSPACCGVEVRAAGAPDGRFVVVWRGGASFPGFDIVGRRFDSAGNPVGGEFVVNSVTTGAQFRADVTMAPDGSFVVAWMNDGFATDVFARRFDASGAPLGGDFQVNRDHEGDASYSSSLAVAGADDGTFVVSWRSGYEYGSETDIIAQRFFNGTVGCTAAPRLDCRKQTSPAGIFQFRNSGLDSADKLVWRWPSGEATNLNEFGDPLTNDAVALCIYDGSAAPQPIATLISPAQGPCRRGVLCWTQLSGPVFRYFDGDKTNDGLQQIYLRAGGDGRTRIGVRAKGEKIPPLPSPPLTTPVTVQLQTSAGACFTATYSGNVTANGVGEFKARPDAP
jgi:hypothetical protein